MSRCATTRSSPTSSAASARQPTGRSPRPGTSTTSTRWSPTSPTWAESLAAAAEHAADAAFERVKNAVAAARAARDRLDAGRVVAERQLRLTRAVAESRALADEEADHRVRLQRLHAGRRAEAVLPLAELADRTASDHATAVSDAAAACGRVTDAARARAPSRRAAGAPTRGDRRSRPGAGLRPQGRRARSARHPDRDQRDPAARGRGGPHRDRRAARRAARRARCSAYDRGRGGARRRPSRSRADSSWSPLAIDATPDVRSPSWSASEPSCRTCCASPSTTPRS